MSGEEFVLAILAMILGASVVIVGITQISKLIRSWLGRDREAHFSDEEFSRLAKAFLQHKKDMERRVQNIEAVIASEEEPSSYPQIEEPKEEGALKNDLEQKRKVR